MNSHTHPHTAVIYQFVPRNRLTRTHAAPPVLEATPLPQQIPAFDFEGAWYHAVAIKDANDSAPYAG